MGPLSHASSSTEVKCYYDCVCTNTCTATGGNYGVTLEKILKFITEQASIPPRGLTNSIRIHYNRDESFPYPTAECYFSIITLPVAYDTLDL